MAFFGKEDRPQRSDDDSVIPDPILRNVADKPASESSSPVQTHLGRGSRVEGRLTFEGSVQIDGQVEGEIHAQESVIIGESAVVTAQIVANSIVVKGRINGDITARKRVELRAPAKLLGNIVTPSILIQEGVVFEGHCSMGTSEARPEKSDKKVAIFPKDDRAQVAVRLSSSEGTK